MSRVLVNFIQDRSGSMMEAWNETLNGFRVFVKDLKEKAEEVEYLFSLTTFDTLVETPYVAIPIAMVDETMLTKHEPRGCTALYDAVGLTIKNAENELHGADKIIVVIVTDGHENASREWTKDTLQKAVEAKLNLGNWTFTYLGTQPETWDDAADFGVATAAVRSYSAGTASQAYKGVSHAVRAMAMSNVKGSRNFMDEFLPDEMMRAAGMGRKPATTAPPDVNRGSSRWR